jgi:hypothetical protein
MWPAEGSVAQQIVQMVASAGIRWMATDEDVLARSLPDVGGFTATAPIPSSRRMPCTARTP